MLEDMITIHTVNETTSSIGDIIEQETTKDIFALIKSVRSSEFYQAMGTGLKPEIVFEIYENEYDEDNDKYITYNNKQYDIIRTYRISLDRIELTCTRKVR